jgi:hypothetical protein
MYSKRFLHVHMAAAPDDGNPGAFKYRASVGEHAEASGYGIRLAEVCSSLRRRRRVCVCVWTSRYPRVDTASPWRRQSCGFSAEVIADAIATREKLDAILKERAAAGSCARACITAAAAHAARTQFNSSCPSAHTRRLTLWVAWLQRSPVWSSSAN